MSSCSCGAIKKMVLSSAGKQFLDYALRILSLGEEAKQALHPTNPAGRLRLGAMEATAASRLIHLLPRFRAICPQVELTLHTQPTQQLTDLVQRAALDCALVSLPVTAEGELVRPTDIDAIPVFDEQLMLVSPEGPADIRLAAFPRGCSYRAIAEAFFASDAHVEIQDVGSYHAMIACIASGGYRGILPQSVIDILPLPDNCQIQPLKQVQTQLIWRRESMSPALSEMRQLLTAGIQF